MLTQRAEAMLSTELRRYFPLLFTISGTGGRLKCNDLRGFWEPNITRRISAKKTNQRHAWRAIVTVGEM
jgi:hypothetical protein